MARVDPRVGGGSTSAANSDESRAGRSPRGRGKRGRYEKITLEEGSIPAWAGEAAAQNRRLGVWRVDPRVGGGSVSGQLVMGDTGGRSPRGRGKRSGPGSLRRRQGSIPAWAGEAQAELLASTPPQVDPRVGGGSGRTSPTRDHTMGRSPRGRGKPARRSGVGGSRGSIPAWAGEAAGESAPSRHT